MVTSRCALLVALVPVVAPATEAPPAGATINVPQDYDFAAFRDIYAQAYRLGLKGCTTFRPNPVSGSILQQLTAMRRKRLPDRIVAASIGKTTELPACRMMRCVRSMNPANGVRTRR